MENGYSIRNDKIEKFHGLTFINTYEKEADDIMLKCFKRDILRILEATKSD